MNLIFFDMEGPLSIQDNAYELMKLFPDGGQVFEVISRYDARGQQSLPGHVSLL